MLVFFAPLGAFATEAQVMLKYPVALSNYPPSEGKSLMHVLSERIAQEPFNLVVTIIFILAILHTFSVGFFHRLAEHYGARHEEKLKVLISYGATFPKGEKPVSFRATILHYFAEVEAVFGIWLIPLFCAFAYFFSWKDAFAYIDDLAFNHQKYTEPLFVMVVMCIAATRPVIYIAGNLINLFARFGNGTPAAWWISIFCVGPLLGSFITEPAAITICAMLLFREFYELKPSSSFKYATLGLLLTTISVGGVLTHFAAPPVLMIAKIWGWNTPFMFMTFGWKAVLGIFLSVGAYYILFRAEFATLAHRAKEHKRSAEYDRYIPLPIVLVHLVFLFLTVVTLHHPAIFIFLFLFFLAFTSATKEYQYSVGAKTPIMVAFFLAGLVTHGSLQAWWIEPLLNNLSAIPLYLGTIVLTSFNDNAAITYLASMVPNFSDDMKYLVVAGAVTGGGLTVIANAPNPAALSILKIYYKEGISPLQLCFSAIPPTCIIALVFYLL